MQIENRMHKILSQYNKALKILAKKAGISKNLTDNVTRQHWQTMQVVIDVFQITGNSPINATCIARNRKLLFE